MSYRQYADYGKFKDGTAEARKAHAWRAAKQTCNDNEQANFELEILHQCGLRGVNIELGGTNLFDPLKNYWNKPK